MFAAIFLIDINENSFAMSYNTIKVNIKLVSYKRIKSLFKLNQEKEGGEKLIEGQTGNIEDQFNERVMND